MYGILDAEACEKRNLDLFAVAAAWKAAGVRLMQYRDKLSSRAVFEERAYTLRTLLPVDSGTFLILNDDPDIAVRCDFDGVHVGQSDASVASAREAVGTDRLVGVSTHSAEQALQAQETDCDYVAVGPVFATSSKADAEQTIGLCGVRAAKAVVRKPLVAIGGIDPGRALQSISAGADTVAVISGLLPSGATRDGRDSNDSAIERYARDFLRRLK